ncbi:response regulator [Pollutibacter soli]|uniref:response regulator n=1 Tax=Pollutibacter soli TaxID=3034157 RepID=UPI003013B4D8
MRKKILLAEDDPDDQELFFEFLSDRTDIDLLPPVENGEVLLERLRQASGNIDLPDAIILDQNMPKCNGLQTLQILKSSGYHAHIPVMIYSTYIDSSLVKLGLSSGAVLVMDKPSDTEGYHSLIDELLKVLD